ncbi:hypothetical protein K438DRAFT_1575821 [Mycena galopus ATCC 62051]|nr:hypothetical protein K438DRAFT_1575821 [Mycena galopus ATCC 62051]
MNPFVQGWSTARLGSQASPTWAVQSSVQPSVYGALPYPTSEPSASPVARSVSYSYTFTFCGTSVLNSVLIGPDNHTHFHIITGTDGCTAVEDASRRNVAQITWAALPTIAIGDLGWTMHTSQWLYLSSDRACRTMITGGETFSWRPNGKFIELFSLNNSDPRALSRISYGPDGMMLQLTLEAVQKRLLKAVVISGVLLMSGRKID